MREIKFRGKVSEDVYDHYASQEPKFKKGTFVYGSLLVEREECGRITKVFIVDQHKGCRVEVDPETVGQYTGEKDGNGNEIYEGDKVLFTISDLRGNSIHRKGVVVFREGAWQIQKSEHHNYEFWFVCKLASEIQITDNIHDNPGILEVPK